MARITAAQYDAYTRAIAKISAAAREQVEMRLRSWLAGNPGATVGEVREMLGDLLDGIGSVYADAASELAAQWYDETVVSSNAKLGEAVTVSHLTNERIERRSRGLAGIYAQGRIESLVSAAGDVADNEVRKTVNETVLANARRDRKENIRFARVTGPGEACTFCMMLASRGAVYWTRKTAGEFDHWHSNCRCTVVAGYEGDPMACLVEGHDPKDALKMWEAFEEIDGDGSLTGAQREAAKRAILEGKTYRQALDIGKSVPHRSVGRPAKAGAVPVPSIEPIGLPNGRGGILKTERCSVYRTNDGKRFIFPVNIDTSQQDMTPQRAIALYERVPAGIKQRMQRDIVFVDYENPVDSYWRKKYKKFTRSYATGGDSITFYAWTDHNDDYVVRTYCHEAGHYIDRAQAEPGSCFSSGPEWESAMTDDYRASGESHPTEYAANSNAEDFAESLAEYAVDGVNFRKSFANRAAIFDDMIGGEPSG